LQTSLKEPKYESETSISQGCPSKSWFHLRHSII